MAPNTTANPIDQLWREVEKLKQEVELLKSQATLHRVDLRQRANSIVAEILSLDATLASKPRVVITCNAPEGGAFDGLFGGTKEEIVRRFNAPNHLRIGGFGLYDGVVASSNVRGEFRLLLTHGFQARFLSRDGICGVIAVGTNEFLGWAMKQAQGQLRINPIVLPEFTYAFCRFAKDCLVISDEPPSKLRYHMEFQGYEEIGASIFFPTSRITAAGDPKYGPAIVTNTKEPSADIEMNFSEEPQVMALSLLKKLYISAGYESDKVPYANPDRTSVDLEALTNI